MMDPERERLLLFLERARPTLEGGLRYQGLKREDLQDIVQETMMRFILADKEFTEQYAIRWMSSVATHLYLDNVVRPAKRRTSVPLPETLEQPKRGLSVNVRIELENAIATLTESERHVVHLWLEGYTAKEISKEIHMRVSTVNLRILTLKRKLRAYPGLYSLISSEVKA